MEAAAQSPVKACSRYRVAGDTLVHQESERGSQSTPGVCIFYNHLSGFGLLGQMLHKHFLGSDKGQGLRGNKSAKYKEHGSSALVFKNGKLK